MKLKKNVKRRRRNRMTLPLFSFIFNFLLLLLPPRFSSSTLLCVLGFVFWVSPPPSSSFDLYSVSVFVSIVAFRFVVVVV